MENSETKLLLDDYYDTYSINQELYKISNKIKSTLAIKTLKNNLRNFIANTNIA